MKWAILSDVHGNLPAFESVMDRLDGGKAVDGIVFLGDVVGYGADPNGCLELLRNTGTLWVAGNHDFGVGGQTDISGFNEVARKSILWSREEIQLHHMNFIHELPLVIQQDGLFLVHSTPQEPGAWNYLLTWEDAKEAFSFFTQDICFAGHSHIPLALCQDPMGVIHSLEDPELEIHPQNRYLINPGSVGQPRDGDPRASVGIYDNVKKTYCLLRVEYDIRSAADGIIRAGLPPVLAHRLYLGV